MRRRRTHLDAIQRRNTHVEEDSVQHRHGDVLGIWEKRGAYPREGGSPFPDMGPWWWGRVQLSLPTSSGREQGCGNKNVLPSG